MLSSEVRRFADGGFDETAYVGEVMRAPTALAAHSTPVDAELHRLRALSAEIRDTIKGVVAEHGDALLSAATAVSGLKRDVAAACERARDIRAATSRMHDEVVAPVAEMRRDADVLRTATAVAALIDAAQRLLADVFRVRIALASTAPTTTATPATDLESLPASIADDAAALAQLAAPLRAAELAIQRPSDRRLLELAIVRPHVPYIARVGGLVRDALRAMLGRAVDALHAVDAGGLLSTLHELGDALPAAREQMDRCADRAAAAVAEALDPRAVALAAHASIEGGAGTSGATKALTSGAPLAGAGGGAGGLVRGTASVPPPPAAATPVTLQPSHGAAAAWRGVLWGRVESACDVLQRCLLQAWSVAFVLSHRRLGGGGVRRFLVADVLAAAGGEAAATLLSDAVPSAFTAAADDDSGPVLSSPDAQAALANPAAALMRRFWLRTTAALHSLFTRTLAADAAAFVKAALVESYPRVHYALLDSLSKVERSVGLRAGTEDAALALAARTTGLAGASRDVRGHDLGFGTVPVPSDGAVAVPIPLVSGAQLLALECDSRRLVWAATPLLRAYLARSVARMTSAVNSLFVPASAAAPAAAGAPARPAAPSAGSAASSKAVDAALVAAGFSSATAFDAAMDVVPPALVPSQADCAAFLKALASELSACRPHGGGGSGGAHGAGAGAASHAGTDAALLAVVCKGVQSVLRQFAVKAEGAIVMSEAAAVVVAQHYMPTQAQLAHWQVLHRLDEVRRWIIRTAAEAPLPADVAAELGLPAHAHAAAAGATDPASSKLPPTSIAAALAHPLPPLLDALATAMAAGGASADAARGCVQGMLLAVLPTLDALVQTIVLPWLHAVVRPLERQVLRLHDIPYRDVAAAAHAAVDAAAAAGATTASPPPSDWVHTVGVLAQSLATNQLVRLPPGLLADSCRSALAARLYTLFVTHAVLVRDADDGGKARLLRDAAHLETALASMWAEPSRLGRIHAEFRALRPLLLTSTVELWRVYSEAMAHPPAAGSREAKIIAVLRVLRPATLLHALTARMPGECDLPHVRRKLTLLGYTDWLDAQCVAGAADAGSAAPPPQSRPFFVDEAQRRRVDAAVRGEVMAVFDAYAQRVAALRGGAGAGAIEVPPEVALARAFDPAALPPPPAAGVATATAATVTGASTLA